MDKLLTALELEKTLNVKRATIYSWTRQGLIPHLRIANKIRYPLNVINEWLERSTKLETNGEKV
jgi:excisionase family DNA binding protein